MRKHCFLGVIGLSMASAEPLEIPAGSHEDLRLVVEGLGAGGSFRLGGDVTMGWKTDGFTGAIDLGGHSLIWDTGGGNVRAFRGVLSGTGAVRYRGGGSHEDTLNAPGWFGGAEPNSFQGVLTLERGTLVLEKPAGVAAFAGRELVIGDGGSNPSILRWAHSDQVGDGTAVMTKGDHPVTLRLGGCSEVMGVLDVETETVVDLGGGSSRLAFADSHATEWGERAQVLVRGWNGVREGGGSERLTFGSSAGGLSQEQLAKIGFAEPEGFESGVYRAKILDSGEVVPSEEKVEPKDLSFAIDDAARMEREKIYTQDGLKRIREAARRGGLPSRIAFFGDSITWQSNGAGVPAETANPDAPLGDTHHYVDQIGSAIATARHPVALINRGLNGGGVLEAETGKESKGSQAGKVYQSGFAELIEKDAIDLAVLYLGVNDAWWRETPLSEVKASLERMVEAAQKRGTRMVLVTPLCIGEKPDGSNPQDEALDQVASLIAGVAKEKDVILVDLRSVFVAWQRNHNGKMRIDGSFRFQDKGLLTYDGVHLTAEGGKLVADHVADGILRASAGIAPAAAVESKPLPALVPVPRSIQMEEGEMILSSSTRVVFGHPSLKRAAEVLAEEIALVGGPRLSVAGGTAKAGDILLVMDSKMEEEVYQIAVGASAGVRGRDFAAVSSGTATLVQWMKVERKKASLPKVKIEDRPLLSYRSLLLDLGRKYHSPQGIEQVIRLCRFYRIRYLHLHLTDDQLFMFPSDRFSKAGESNAEFARFEPASLPKVRPYTKKELADLDRFARDRGVWIIPEIDLPGHSGRLIADEPEAFAGPGGGSTVDLTRDKTFKAVEELLNEVMDAFPDSPYVHLGADEVNLGGFEESKAFQDLRKKEPEIQSAHDLFQKFVLHLCKVVQRRGKRPIVWEEGWKPDGPYALPKEAVVMIWNQHKDPQAVASAGYDVINTTWTPLYLVRDNKKTASFLHEWMPHLFGREGSESYVAMNDPKRLLGVQLSSWENSESIEIQGLRERAAIVSEKAWNPDLSDDYESFRRRWEPLDRRLDVLVHPIELKVQGEMMPGDDHSFRGASTLVELSSRVPGMKIRYTLDNQMPDGQWKDYEAPILVDRPVHLRAGLFDRSGKLQGYLVGAWLRPEGSAPVR